MGAGLMIMDLNVVNRMSYVCKGREYQIVEIWRFVNSLPAAKHNGKVSFKVKLAPSTHKLDSNVLVIVVRSHVSQPRL